MLKELALHVSVLSLKDASEFKMIVPIKTYGGLIYEFSIAGARNAIQKACTKMYQNPTLFCILFLAFGLLSCSEEPDWTAENVLNALGEETGRKDIVSRGVCPSNHKCHAKVLRLRLEDVCTSHVSVSIQTRAKFLLRRLRRGGMRDGDMKHVRIDTMTDTSKVEEWEGWLDVKKNHATFPEHPFRSPRG